MASYQKQLVFESVEERTCLTSIDFVAHTQSSILTTSGMVDIDGDGHLDLIGVNSAEETWHWRRNGGNGKDFEVKLLAGPTPSTSDFQFLNGPTVGDLDSDGDVDLVFYDGMSVSWYENIDGRGEFVLAQTLVSDEWTPQLNVGDLDDDGDLDIVRVGPAASLVWHENFDGHGQFGDAEFIDFISEPDWSTVEDVAVGDLDGNEVSDPIIALRSRGDHIASEITWYAGDTARTIEPPCNGGTVCKPLSIDVGDIDGDGDTDINVLTNHTIGWIENIVQGQRFDSHILTRVDTATGPMGAAWLGTTRLSDLDADGDLDMITGLVSDSGDDVPALIWHENRGGGEFAETKSLFPVSAPTSGAFLAIAFIHLGDLDSDGDVDVVDGAGTIYESQVIAKPEPVVGDLDLDGKVSFVDFLVLAENFGRTVDVIREDGDLDGDGGVTFLDFLILAQNFGV